MDDFLEACLGIIVIVVILAVVLLLINVSIPPSNHPIVVYQGGHTMWYCKTIDSDGTVAHGCRAGLWGNDFDYHLGSTDGWRDKRK